MKIKEFNRQNLGDVRDYLNSIFEEIKNDTGIEFSIGNISFDSEIFSTKLSARIDDGKNEEERRKSEFCKYAPMFGLCANDYGKSIDLGGGKQAYLIGIKPNNRKYPFIVEGVNTKSKYKVNTRTVLNQLKNS